MLTFRESRYNIGRGGTYPTYFRGDMRVLIAVKTYPIPSATYDELVCTAGVTEGGEFVRLYPINFRDLPWDRQYRKYQWIEVAAKKHVGRDTRKESYRPDCETVEPIGEPIDTKNNWSQRAKYLLKNEARSMEELHERQDVDRTSLGVFRPKVIHDLIIKREDEDWKAGFKNALAQARLFENRKASKQPPRKVPFKFQYQFECDDPRCNGHQMMIEDWEVGALYWRLRDQGLESDVAAAQVRQKFLGDICSPDKDTRFIVGTILAHPKSWVVIGLFYPKKTLAKPDSQGVLFAS